MVGSVVGGESAILRYARQDVSPRTEPITLSVRADQLPVTPSTEKSGMPNEGCMYQLVTFAGW